jgi:outer membrane immunogenic protein
MKSMISAIAVAIAAAAVPTFAQAQDAPTGVYANVGYAHADIDPVKLGGIQGRLGYRANNWFGVEGELAFGVKGDTVAATPTLNVKMELDYQAAIYGVGFLPIAENTDLLARVGYGKAKISGSAAGVGASVDDTSWNFGVGGQYHFDGVNGVRIDYTHHEFDDGDSADAWSVVYSRRF